jgi:HEAT repeat protein
MPAPLTLVALLLAAPFWPDAVALDAREVADAPGPERLRALELIAAEAGDRATPLLRSLLADPDPGVRLYATRRMIRAGDPAGADAAAARIIAPGAPSIDRQLGLELLRDAPTLPPAGRRLAERALHDGDAGVRAAALDLFRRHGPGDAVPAILATFDDDNREVRLRAVRIIAASRDPRAGLSLLGAIDDSDRQVRVEAARALGSYPRALPALLRLAQGTNPGDRVGGNDELRAAAIDALADLRADAAVPLLGELARRRVPDELARHAQLALGQIATPAAIAALVALTATPPVADETRQALRRAGPTAVPALSQALDQGTPTAAAIAAALLGEIGDRRATPSLIATAARRPDLTPVVIASLRLLRDPTAVPLLVRAAESPMPELRRRALEALLALGDPRAVAVVDRGLGDPDAPVRALSARLAAAHDVQTAVPTLATRIFDPDREVRDAAADAVAALAMPSPAIATAFLGSLGRPGAAARDDEEWATVGAALARLIDPREPAALDAAAATATGPSRIAIDRALAAAHERRPLEDRAVVARLVASLEEGGAVARAAADALATARTSERDVPALARAYAGAPAELRARLCPAIAGAAGGGAWLAAVMAAPDEAVPVRAAAAWAARGLDEAGAALRAAAAAPEAPDDPAAAIGANARAALAAPGRDGATAWSEVRLHAPDGTPAAARWLAVRAANGLVVWTQTDAAGVARVHGLPEGALELHLPAAGRLASSP